MMNFSKLAVAGAMFAFASIAAQAQIMRVSVPFKFHAGSQVLPAGDYEVRIDQASRRVTVANLDGRAAGFHNFKNSVIQNESNRGSLVFHAYGDSYFLHAVRPKMADGAEMYTSRAERETARSLPLREVSTPVMGSN